ncbi:response regulator [Marinoscillum pacificum]|uniref:response regulator n=1 Tax=Marinoscillum pacificum TaxID=392723 RepID=UPI002157CABA|nr:response regulator [Marinoscillum pacificum]
MDRMTCIAIDDDSLFLRTIKLYLDQMDWVVLKETFTNPVRAAKGILQLQPQLILVDYEMPLVDGDYLIDWIKPKLDLMKRKPFIVLLSAVDEPPKTLLNNVDGFINKSMVRDIESLEVVLKELVHQKIA